MSGYITVCFSDWTNDTFSRGVMRIVRGVRTEYPLRRPLLASECEGKDYYVKEDPDFKNFTYRKCHKGLRKRLEAGDILFFRTLWRRKPYIIGYFVITGKRDGICLADREKSVCIDFRMRVTKNLVKVLNPSAVWNRKVHFNKWVNAALGRNYLKLGPETTARFMQLIILTSAVPKDHNRP